MNTPHTLLLHSAVCLVAVLAWGCDGDDGDGSGLGASGLNDQGVEKIDLSGGDMGQEDATADMMDQSTPFEQFADCPVEARPIYVIDAEGFKLLSFDPDNLAFTEVGDVASCPSEVQGATPFSMAVDRDANAWVLYNSGELFLYGIQDKSCIKTKFSPTQDFALFGMGFVLDWPNVNEDILYIAGSADGPGGDESEGSSLGSVDFAGSSYAKIAGPLEGDPELTGTASGQLWGFFPNTEPAKVAQINRETGVLGESFEIPQITDQALAWAFAFWGGDFWVFYTGQGDESTRVIRVNPRDNQVTEVISDTGYLIVGAGVSTCAPLENK